MRGRDSAVIIGGDAVATLTASHFRLLDQLPPDGARVTDVAQRIRINKEVLGQLAGNSPTAAM